MSYSILLSFKKESDAKLAVFGSDVVSRMKGNARYPDEQVQVAVVETAQQSFQSAINAASDGGRTLIEIKKEKRAVLLTELTLLVRMLELHLSEDITFFTEAGFVVRKRPVRHKGPLAQPVLKYVKQGVMSGTVDGESEHFPKGVRQIGVEYSSDSGTTWKNGTYSTGKRFTLAGLVPKSDYLVRITYLGTHQRLSDWSEGLSLFVL